VTDGSRAEVYFCMMMREEAQLAGVAYAEEFFGRFGMTPALALASPKLACLKSSLWVL
jgi:hypothetical protein